MQGGSVRQFTETYNIRDLRTNSAFNVVKDDQWQSLQLGSQEQNNKCDLVACKEGYYCALCLTFADSVSTACIPNGMEC
jgi:hypothetical protein